ncbi:MAG: hypothetical protein GX556_06925 [Fibrobacter sp.]|nr:hypothetical protein [Fibrobacter sp.]
MKHQKFFLISLIFLSILMQFQCNVLQRRNGNSGSSQEEALAKADISGFLPNTIKGTLFFNLVEERGMVISGEIAGLLPDSSYALHIMNGTCDSTDSLSDFDPGNAGKHGPPWLSPSQHRAGILPNITANGDGKAQIEISAPCLDAVPGSSFSVLNHILVIFSGPDNYQTGPAGQKIACGKITAATPESIK